MSYTSRTFEGTPDEVEAQWLEARREGIGGSDAAAILGLSKYSTPITVWLDKTRGVSEYTENEPAHWGKKLEATVAEEFAERHPELTVERLDAILTNNERKHMQASLDRIIKDKDGNTYILEIKTADARLKDDWTNGVPDYYYPQVLHYMCVTGYRKAYVAVLIGGNHYDEFELEYDEADAKFLIEQEEKFWELVTSNTMPEVTGSQADSQALMSEYPTDCTSEIRRVLDAPDIARLLDLQAESKQLDAQIKEIQNQIRKEIGDDAGIRTEEYQAKWIRSTRTSYDTKRLFEDHPELKEKYSVSKQIDMGIRIKRIED